MKTLAIQPYAAGYPAAMSLWALVAGSRAPPIYLRGALPQMPGVAIVGTRDPTPEAAAFATHLAEAVVAARLAVWSGGAKGIDTAVHEGALRAGGHTVAVLTGCFDDPYPAQNAGLFERIVARGGTLLSLQGPGGTRTHPDFVRRNGVMAALAHATVVVQARPGRSGAMSMARATQRMGRPLLVVPHPPWSTQGAGCAILLANGATPIASIGAAVEQLVATVRSPSQLVLPLATPAATTRSEAPTEDEPATPELDEDAEVVLGALKSGALGSDALCARTGLGFPRVSRALLTLSLRGLALQISTGAYCLAPGGPSGSPP